MIKVEHKLMAERGVLALAFESSAPDDIPLLDVLQEVLSNPAKYQISCGYVSTNRLVAHVRGFDKEDLNVKSTPTP